MFGLLSVLLSIVFFSAFGEFKRLTRFPHIYLRVYGQNYIIETDLSIRINDFVVIYKQFT